jgi:hypothetical protein
MRMRLSPGEQIGDVHRHEPAKWLLAMLLPEAFEDAPPIAFGPSARSPKATDPK